VAYDQEQPREVDEQPPDCFRVDPACAARAREGFKWGKMFNIWVLFRRWSVGVSIKGVEYPCRHHPNGNKPVACVVDKGGGQFLTDGDWVVYDPTAKWLFPIAAACDDQQCD
jgi:hypothetical protein